jgi:ATP-binding cassette, subfamily B, bacterial
LLVVLAYVDDLYGPVRALTRLSGTFAKAGASLARLREVHDSEERVGEDPAPAPLPALQVGVRVERVSFRHTAARPVLHELDLWFPAGQVTAVVGPNGAGKSTLLHLLLRLDDPDAGRITLDGVDVRQVKLAVLRRGIAFVPQDPWLFDGTVAENIAVTASAATTRADVRDAATAAGLDALLGRLPHGLDTPLGESGTRLSGGERRRVALARAVLSTAPLLLLDEPTAALDAQARAAVLRSLAAATTGRTTVVVTHDDAVIRLADRVVELHPVGPDTTPRREVDHAVHREPAGGGTAVTPWRSPTPAPPPHADPLAEPFPQPRLTT